MPDESEDPLSPATNDAPRMPSLPDEPGEKVATSATGPTGPKEIDYEIVSTAPTEAIVALYEAGGWWHEDPDWRAAIPRMISGSFCFLIARESGGRIVGMGRAISDGVSDAYIQDVVVLRDFRGRGIGREIVRRLTERCREAGISWIGLIAEPGTRAFYEALGYGALQGYEPMLHGHKGPR